MVEVPPRRWTIDIVVDLPDDSVLLIDLDPVAFHDDVARDLRKAVAFEGEGFVRVRADSLASLPAPAVVVLVHAPTGRTPVWTWVQALAPLLADVGLSVAPLSAEAVRLAVATAGRQWVIRKDGAPNPSARDVRPDLAEAFVANLDRPGLGLDLLPPTSDDLCGWRCRDHDLTWTTSVKSRVGRRAGGGATRRGSGCPACELEAMTARSRAQALPVPGASLADRFPELAAGFRGCVTRPELTVDMLRCTSTYLCLWWCEGCRSEYRSTPARRVAGKGCRGCGRRRAGLKRRSPAPGRSLAERFPCLVEEFLLCPTRPDDGPAQIAGAANVVVRWKCGRDDHEWSATVNDRANGQGCPRCGRRRTADARARPAPGRSVADLLPELAAQWVANETHPGRAPSNLALGSGDRCVWRCAAGHPDWTAVVSSRAQGRGCPTCGRQQAQRTRALQRSR